MKTIKVAVLINVLLYGVLLFFSVWAAFTIAGVIGPRFHEFFSSPGFFPVAIRIIPFVMLFNGPPVFCIIGMLRRKNWGRILTIVVNIFLVISLSGNIIYMIFVKELSFLAAMTSQTAFLTYIAATPFIALTIVLFRREAKSYFARSKH